MLGNLTKLAVAVAVVLVLASAAGASAAFIVQTNDIANGAVTHSKLASNSVWHNQLGGSSVTHGNMANNSVWHDQIGSASVQANNLDSNTAGRLAYWFTANPATSVGLGPGSLIAQSGGPGGATITQVGPDAYKLPVTLTGNCAVVASGEAPGSVAPYAVNASADPSNSNQVDVNPGNKAYPFSVAVYCDKNAGAG